MNDSLSNIAQAPSIPAPYYQPEQAPGGQSKAAQSAYQRAQDELESALDQLKGLPDGLQSRLQRALRPTQPVPAVPQCATAPKAPASLVVGELEDTARVIRDVVRKINDILSQVEL